MGGRGCFVCVPLATPLIDRTKDTTWLSPTKLAQRRKVLSPTCCRIAEVFLAIDIMKVPSHSTAIPYFHHLVIDAEWAWWVNGGARSPEEPPTANYPVFAVKRHLHDSYVLVVESPSRDHHMMCNTGENMYTFMSLLLHGHITWDIFYRPELLPPHEKNAIL